MARGSSSTDSTIRLLNLVALLTEASAPMTIEQIANEMKSLEVQFRYPEKFEARRTMFNRDKKALKELGIEITMTTRGGDDAGKGEYIINKDSYSLINFGLTAEEMEALQIAAAVVQIEKPWGRHAVRWLGGAVEDPPTGAVAHVPTGSADLAALFAAVRSRSEARFTYHGRARTVHPYGLVSRKGFWYLVGLDTGHAAERTFRVDRIEGDISVGDPGAFERPGGFDIESAVPADPKRFRDGESEHATVRVEANLVSGIVRELGEESMLEMHPDGSADFRVPCGNRPAFRSWLFALVDHAEVLSPADVRAETVAELARLAAAR